MVGAVRLSAASAIAALLAGCVEPTVDRVVTWVHSVDDGNGRPVEVYDRGRRYAVRMQPTVPGADISALGMRTGPRGEGVFLSGERQVVYFGFLDARQPTLTPEPLGGGEVASTFTVTRNGDAVLRSPEGSGATRFAFMPVSSQHAGQESQLLPPDGLVTDSFSLVSASDAPVFAWVEHAGSPSRAAGRIAAFAYPSDRGFAVDDVTELGHGQLYATPPPLVSDLQIDDGWCPHRTCLSPDGRGVITPAPGRCRFWTWRWSDAPGPSGEIAPREVAIVDGCPEEPRAIPALVAAIDVDLAVLDDGDRVYLADLSAGTLRSVPKLWDSPGRVRLGEGGRVVVLVSDDSRVVRVDADGPRVVSAEAIPCTGPPSEARISANGLWMARACSGDGTFEPASQAILVRVSPLGAETFVSIPMEVLSIDDEGNVLMYSHADSGEPRGLFVLDDDGGVTRIDALEPEPNAVKTASGNDGYFGIDGVQP